ncbi:PH, RCC1 and FYVE domains-containing protein 1-like isoform X1 [Salvia splendens]|uniref:PH, RCC1 and FYVE domains-containing protein 1-like isoform X1 n=1 Tax=Salvia splendens TaxID=180675 RepID=UPI001C26FC96|nr:PH, RCC1 and FYVE domains-containing protein 1-like isoform X1 [Salvia splendens]XP_042028608.1 PH, RCC1 and FYVE domains-containing protein 1-like isoform X1 [Salvia splendens]XP_042028609.1 PH, RCC1 and FYVE domains-containing protein 1-like isoform X1 [Salvia splendens]
MADPPSFDIDQALILLKKGTQLIKYSRKGKPKFCAFRLSPDEATLIWYSHGSERQLKLSSVSRIIQGQRTPVFKRFLRPEKEYLSFSLIHSNGERSLDLICKDKVEAEIWISGLKSLISTGQSRSRRTNSNANDLHEFGALDCSPSASRRVSTDSRDSSVSSSSSHVGFEFANMQRTSCADGFRVSVSSNPSCSSLTSGPDDIESLGDVFLWGEIWSDGGDTDGTGKPVPVKVDVLTPKPLETNIVLDVHQIACGVRHIALVTRQGEVFTWGEESGGRLGHGIEKDFSRPRLIEFLAVTNIDYIACGEFHTGAISSSGDLYTWGDGTHNAGLLGHGNDVSHWIPKRVSGLLEGLQVLSVACGTWHSALATSSGKLFTFGDGMFGALGHGDRKNVPFPKEVNSLSGLKTIAVSCGVWHTAAIIEVGNQSGANVLSRKLFTWGDGDKYRLGHGNKDTYLSPTCVSSLIDYNIQQLACGHNMTIALTTSGHVFSMGNNAYGQLGNPQSDGKAPCLVQDRLVGEFVEQISCGADHAVVFTTRGDVFTWGRGANGRLGHGDTEDRNVPTLVEALKDKHVRNISCGSNYTMSICVHKWVSGVDQSTCTACRQAFGFTRKRRSCYNCGMVHCHNCISKKAMRAALAPTPGKPHRVCDSCYMKLKKAAVIGTPSTVTKASATRRSGYSNSRINREKKRSRVLLPSAMEPVRYLEIKSAGGGLKADSYSVVRASQVPSLVQLRDVAFPSSFSALQYALKPVNISSSQPQPQYQSISRPASPYSRRASPPPSSTPVYSRGVIDSLKMSNEILSQEIAKLQNQAKNLRQNGEIKEKEIHKLMKSADDATLLAADRSFKCIRATQATNTITAEMKEIRNKLPPEISEGGFFQNLHAEIESLLETIHMLVSEDNSTFPAYQNHYENNTALHGLSNYREDMSQTNELAVSSATTATRQPSSENAQMEGQREVTEQFEPGVYVTLIQLANGTKIYKGVRFSKRRFAEQQAEGWWKENKDRLLKKYCPNKRSRPSSEALPTPTDQDNPEAQETN